MDQFALSHFNKIKKLVKSPGMYAIFEVLSASFFVHLYLCTTLTYALIATYYSISLVSGFMSKGKDSKDAKPVKVGCFGAC